MSTFPPIGHDLTVGPIPIVEDETTFVPAGVLEIGYATRIVDSKAIARSASVLGAVDDGRTAEQTEAYLRELDENPPGGVALHVREASTHREYLRFDCFDDGPHYHYIVEPDVAQTIVGYDVDANGPVYPWALERLRHHLPALLTRAGRPDLAARLDPDAIAAAVDAVARGVADLERVSPTAA
ncbi:conserved hypothetical protein [Frankia canadensis]|uniref:DUF7700 domain-containing protein n=1 Tax=Frankia canadensis TaxID=1836972 RepID=A0A2I2L1G2_9ACTN|nr:hypothetical protein [Frankia canadensis]SNQ51745.1 conserved hypothetical protein [Frankia canadensis]SOU59035.1 conserved hypothetical protein [Frankia canadensis]